MDRFLLRLWFWLSGEGHPRSKYTEKNGWLIPGRGYVSWKEFKRWAEEIESN
jgi:hypothetical protein